MSPSAINDQVAASTNAAARLTSKATSILLRTPWKPPNAISAEGIYIDLEDGRRVIDAVGGAAVACIGNGHPAVKKAIKEQVDKISCMRLFFRHSEV